MFKRFLPHTVTCWNLKWDFWLGRQLFQTEPRVGQLRKIDTSLNRLAVVPQSVMREKSERAADAQNVCERETERER